jgi:PAS domain S-box-containing protein
MSKSFSHNEPFLKIAYDESAEAIIVTDQNYLITYLNPTAEKLLGKTLPLLKGKNIVAEIKISDIAGRKKTGELLTTFLKGNKVVNNEVILENFNKKKLRVCLRIKFVTKKKAKTTDYIFRFSESSTEKDLHDHLLESEKKYKGLFEHAQEGIFILDDKGKIVDANPSAEIIYGKDNFFGMSVFELFPQNSASDSRKFWKEFMEKGIVAGYYKYTMPNGAVSYIDYKAKSNYLPNLHLAVFSNVTERRLTEKALLNSEANLKAIFDSSEQNVILLDLSYSILASNVKADENSKNVLGKPLRIGESILNYIQDKELFIHEFNKAKKGDKLVVEKSIIGSNGEENWFELVYVPIKDSKGNVASICYTSANINSRKREALVLGESEKKFRTLAENSPDIIYILDLISRKVSYFNRDNILGYQSSSLTTSEAWIEIVHPGDYERVVEHWSKFLKSRSNKAGSIEYRIRGIEGEYDWVSNRHIIIERTKKGLPSKALLNITIMTDRIRVQEALKESEARLKALIENTSDLVWSVDNELTLTAANSSFNELIKNNYKKKIKVGDNLYAILPNLTKDGWLALHITALKGKRVMAEFSWLSKKKENIFYEISYNPIYDANNNVSGVSVFARDITQRKTNEATIVQTNFELDSFVYRASHDLRAPLRSILGLVNIINNQANEDDKVNYLRLIEKSAIKLDNFISDLINFSRNSRASVDIEVVDFSTIILECKETLRFMESADKVEFISKVKEGGTFYSDPKRIAIFMNNFLSNTIKYQNPNNKKKSFVNIQVITTKANAVITIQDNGVGIKKEYQSKIFNMFFRASENSFGSGLGLYIARQAVERLGGIIKVDSKLGIGTTFVITLPNLEDKIFDFTSI